MAHSVNVVVIVKAALLVCQTVAVIEFDEHKDTTDVNTTDVNTNWC